MTRALMRLDPIRASALPNPFSIERTVATRHEGVTLTDLMAATGVRPWTDPRVFIERNGHVYGPIPPTTWARVRPRRGSHVVIRAMPRGGGGGGDKNKTLRTILQVVIIAIAIVIIVVSWGTLTYFALALILLAVALSFALINYLLPPVFPLKHGTLRNVARGESPLDEGVGTLTGARNRSNPYGPIPVVFGQHRLFPPYGAAPFTEIVGQDQYLRQLFLVGHGPLDITDMRIGVTPLANFQGVETEVRQGYSTDEPLTLYTDDVAEEPLSIALTVAAGPQIRTGQQNADEISVDVAFVNGLSTIQPDGSQTPFTVQITVEYRKVADTEWIKPPGSPLVITDNRLSVVRKGLRWKVHQQVRPTSDITVGTWITAPLWSKLDEQVASDADLIQSALDPVAQACEVRCAAFGADPLRPTDHLVRYRIGKDVTAGKGIDITVALVENVTVRASWVHAAVDAMTTYTQTLTEAQAASITDYGNLRFRFTANVTGAGVSRRGQVSWCELDFPRPAASFEVRMTRDTADNADILVHDDATWAALRTIRKTAPVTLTGVCLVALRIKASDQLNGVVDSFNCLAQAILPDWNGSAWVTQPTSSPAAAYRATLQGKGNARPVADARLHLPSLEQWAVDAAAKNMTFNQAVDFRHTVFEQLRDIASASRAAFTMIDGKFGIVQDKSQATPVQHFTPRNSFNFHARKAFLDFPHALKVRFTNPDADWQQDEVIVYDDGFSAGNATKFEVMDTLGITNSDQAWRIGRYFLAVMRLRPETYEFGTDFENIICTRGDLVRLSHDVLLVGLAVGRVLSVQTSGPNCTGITLDQGCPMAAGPSYGVRMRYADGSSVVKSIVNNPGEQTVLVFTTPFAAPHPAVGDLVLFGESGLESIPVIVKEIIHDRDITARISALPYNEAIYTADAGAIPPFTSNITLPPLVQRTPPVPVIVAVDSDEDVLIRALDGSFEARIVITLSYQPNSDIKADYLEVKYRRSDSTSPFIALMPLPPDTPLVSIFPVEEGATYDVHLRTVSTLTGAISVWVIVANHLVVGKATAPPAPTGLVLQSNGALAWLYPISPLDFLGFQIRRIPGSTATWDQGLLLHDGVHSASNFATLPTMYGQWTFMVKAKDTAGLFSALVSLTHDFGLPVVNNAVETRNEHASGFPGTKVDCTVQGGSGNLIADQLTTGFWSTDSAIFWTADGNLFWVGTYKAMTYTWTYVTGANAGGTTLLIDIGAQGNWKIEYKKTADSTWILFPGAVPGILASTSYDLRVSIDAGPVQGIISKLIIYFDAPNLTELHQFFVTAVTTGTRLTLQKVYRAIKTVTPTVVASGAETAITAIAADKQNTQGANNGPLIKTFDAAGVVVAGHVDVLLEGY